MLDKRIGNFIGIVRLQFDSARAFRDTSHQIRTGFQIELFLDQFPNVEQSARSRDFSRGCPAMLA